MSAISPTGPAIPLPPGALPPIDPAGEPESVRHGDAKAKQAYQEGLAFEDILVNELAQELTRSVPGLSDGGAAGSGPAGSGDSGSGDSGSGGLAGGSAIGAYSALLPQALTTSIMSGGGTGIALQIAQVA